MNCCKENNILILETGKKINFDFPVKGIIDSKHCDSIMVQVDVPAKQLTTENIFCISKEDGMVRCKSRTQKTKFLYRPADEDQTIHQKCVVNWSKKDNVLIIENSKRVSFDYPIGSVLETAGIIIITLEIPPGQSMTENVFGVSREGEILWQIERIPVTATNPINRYTGLWEDPPGVVVASNWNCTDVYIDAKTGKVIDTVFTK